MEQRPPDNESPPLQTAPPTLDYGRPEEVVALSVWAYVMATLSAMFVFAGAFILLSIVVSALLLPMFDYIARPIFAIFVLVLSCAAAVSSFRDTLKTYRKRKAKK